jgi:hypothetical protein
MNILTTVYRNGIVNQVQIVEDLDDQDNKTHTQLIWNGQIRAMVVGLNREPSEHGGTIKNYKAIYLNGIMIVKHGKVWPRRWWQF